MLALRQPFSPRGHKVIVLVTDAPPHIPDKETQSIEEVVTAIKQMEVEQFLSSNANSIHVEPSLS